MWFLCHDEIVRPHLLLFCVGEKERLMGFFDATDP